MFDDFEPGLESGTDFAALEDDELEGADEEVDDADLEDDEDDVDPDLLDDTE